MVGTVPPSITYLCQLNNLLLEKPETHKFCHIFRFCQSPKGNTTQCISAGSFEGLLSGRLIILESGCQNSKHATHS